MPKASPTLFEISYTDIDTSPITKELSLLPCAADKDHVSPNCIWNNDLSVVSTLFKAVHFGVVSGKSFNSSHF
jgi:hypothetical protein